MNKAHKTVPLTLQKTQDERRLFIEALSGLLSTYSHLDFDALPQLLENNPQENSEIEFSDYISPHSETHVLVGVLPNILNNHLIFPSKEKMADFAHEALNLNISWRRKSKYEMIGHIICAINRLNKTQLAKVMRILKKKVHIQSTKPLKIENSLENNSISSQVKYKKSLNNESNTSEREWNDAIRQLYW